MSSSEIAALSASFQQQSMAQMQHAAMISSYGMRMTGGEQMMGGAVNRASAIGGPLAMGALGLAGLDPFSMGIRGGMAGYAAGGAMGAVGGAALGAGAVALPLMAAQYTGGQMLQGMQQQQMMNAQLRGSFQFMSPTGRGFSQGELGDIGQSMRQMSMQRGPAGEMTSFDELGRMASMMGRMGLAEGVRSAKEFNDRFQQMMKSVKEIAQAFSTSLEEAQQIMGGMRQSGIFRNQGGIAQQIRGYATAGNLATSEITSAMGIGSQISRMIGGRGAAGAMGGMQTIGQIGIAQQMGTLSEEDIFNATGLTGAEGRQAMATQMMQSSAKFLQGGLGRRFLASVAGKGGKLDESSVEEYMMGGGVGTGRTMEMAYRNLGKTGRADFIRNEGRLRGEALGRFGGLTNVMAMRGWLEERGFDLSSGQDDRAMIFMQRRLGMGADEADNMVKMARDLPLLMRQREASGLDADFRSRMDQQRKHIGLEGIKHKLEDARNKVQGTLQQAGAQFYQDGSNMLERWINQITGDFVTTVNSDVAPAIRDVLRGGAYGASVGQSRFGLGKGLMGGLGNDVFGGGMSRGNAATFKMSGDQARFSQAGYNVAAGSDRQFNQSMQWVYGLQASYQEGAGAGVEGIGAGSRDEILRLTSMGGLGGSGVNRLGQFGKMLEGSSNARMQELSLRYAQADNNERARIMSSVMKGAGLGGYDSSFMALPQQQSLFGLSGYATTRDRDSAVGEYMLSGASTGSGVANQKLIGGATRGDLIGGAAKHTARGLLNSATFGLSALTDFGLSDSVGRSARGRYNEGLTGISSATQESAGRFLMSEQGMDLARGALSRDQRVRDASTQQAMLRNLELQQRARDGSRDMNTIEMGEFEANRSMIVASEVAQLLEQTGGNPSEQQKADLVRKYGGTIKSWEDAKARAGAVMGAVSEEQRGARRELFRRAGEQGRADIGTFRTAGLYAGGKLTAQGIGAFGNVGKVEQIGRAGLTGAALGGLTFQSSDGTMAATTGQQFIAAMAKSADVRGGIIAGGDDSYNQSLLAQAGSFQQEGLSALGRMSEKEMRQLADQLRTSGGPEGLRQLVMRSSGIRSQLEKAKGRPGGADLTMANMLGVNIKAEDLKGLDADKAAALISQQALGDKYGTDAGAGFSKDLAAAIKAQREGKTGDAAVRLEGLQGSGVLAEARKAQQEAQSEQSDPSFRKLGEIKTALEQLPAKMGKSMEGIGVTVKNIAELKPPE